MLRAVLVGLVLVGGAVSVGAQDVADEAVVEEDVGYAYGSVAELDGDQLVVNEFDEVTGGLTTQTYTIAPDAALYDVEAVTEIAVGDEVDIDYVLQGGERVAVAIAVGKFVEEDAEAEVE